MSQISMRKAKEEDLESVQALSDELALSDLPYDNDVDTKWAHGAEGESYYREKISEKDGVCFVAEIGV